MFSSMGKNVFAISAIKAFLGKGLPKEPGKSPASFGKFTVVQLMPIPTIRYSIAPVSNPETASVNIPETFCPLE